ncbi:hypothetical protein [Candidatus Villigracilis affinis]|uniref:hypothetical protein n=1 Tax=Candidatus Villigracilis affinis TaxID=3140682 RepID=UPI001D3676CF|nr:hypothetical protein [Anaerolineales bacterium]
MQTASPKNIIQLFTIGLVSSIVFAFLEIKALWTLDQIWNKLLTPLGVAAIVVYILFAIAGITVLFLSLWNPTSLRAFAQKMKKLRWLVAFVAIGFVTWIYLFSPWQMTLTMPWTQFIVAAALARLLAWCFVPEQDQPFGWSDLALAFSIFLYPRIVQEVRQYFPAPLLTRGSIAVGFAFQFALLAVLYESVGKTLLAKLIELRSRLEPVRLILAALFLLAPFVYRYSTGPKEFILYFNIRFMVVLIALWFAAYLLCKDSSRLISSESFGVAAGWLVLVSAITRSLLLVVDDPFGLYWSEGNRLYDYSLVFGQDLYNYTGRIPDPYNTPGRYGLWGVLYLWQGLPIWAHRLWNVALLTIPSFVLAWALTKKLSPSFLRQMVFLWVTAFFILLAPLHPPFMIMTVIVALFIFHPSPYVRGASLVAASLYAGISRWTWVFAPGAWGALTDLLLFYPKREGNWFKRLLPTILMAVLGAVPGFLLNIGNFLGYTTGENTTAQQPLLWYRLLPNLTLGPGIVLLILLTTGPLLVLLAYKMSTRQWKLDGFQLLAVWGALIGFFTIGLVISTKIGGGGDLHNLDMYIGTLIVVTMLGLTGQVEGQDVRRWSSSALTMLCLLAILPIYPFTPFHPSAGSHAWLDLPTREDTDKALKVINDAVGNYSELGEVLFMDQRQLLTFGYVKAIPFVPEFEKKYMMDQALASNETYFRPYYQDLADNRFALIVTEPLKVGLKEEGGVFSEENDLWVRWVSAPTLCFYEQIHTDKTVGIELLVPRENPVGCEKYLK